MSFTLKEKDAFFFFFFSQMTEVICHHSRVFLFLVLILRYCNFWGLHAFREIFTPCSVKLHS